MQMDIRLDVKKPENLFTGIFVDGLYLQLSPPVQYDESYHTWAVDEAQRIGKDHPICMQYRHDQAAYRRRLEEDERREKSQQHYDDEYLDWQMRGYLYESMKEGLNQDHILGDCWKTALKYKYKAHVEDKERNRQIAIQALQYKRKYKDLAVEFGISPDRISQIVGREQRRMLTRRPRMLAHNPVGQLLDPDNDVNDRNCLHEWNVYTQIGEFASVTGEG